MPHSPQQNGVAERMNRTLMESARAKEWKAATDSEFDSLMESETWELVELPPNRN